MNKLLNRPYVFFFPYRGVGGVPVLFLRIANYLAEKYGLNSYVIDYSDGYMAINPKHNKVKLIDYDLEKNIIIPEDSILIFQSDLPWGLPRNLVVNKNTTAFFWNCYPFNLIPVLPGKAREWTSNNLFLMRFILNSILLPSKIKANDFIKMAIRNHALVFMDGPNLFTTQYCLGAKLPLPIFLPIAIQTPALINRLHGGHNTLRICWLGRIADFKIYSLLRVIEDLARFASQRKTKILLQIVGSGDRENLLKANLSTNEFFNIELIPQIPNYELDKFLLQNVDLLFAMGTSALEGAKLKIPTVSMDFSYRPISDSYKYRFIFEAENFSLGDLVKNTKNKHTMSEVISLYIDGPAKLGDKCYSYFTENHSLERQVDHFLQQSQKSSLYFENLLNKSFTKKPSFYVIWKWIKKILH